MTDGADGTGGTGRLRVYGTDGTGGTGRSRRRGFSLVDVCSNRFNVGIGDFNAAEYSVGSSGDMFLLLKYSNFLAFDLKANFV